MSAFKLIPIYIYTRPKIVPLHIFALGYMKTIKRVEQTNQWRSKGDSYMDSRPGRRWLGSARGTKSIKNWLWAPNFFACALNWEEDIPTLRKENAFEKMMSENESVYRTFQRTWKYTDLSEICHRGRERVANRVRPSQSQSLLVSSQIVYQLSNYIIYIKVSSKKVLSRQKDTIWWV